MVRSGAAQGAVRARPIDGRVVRALRSPALVRTNPRMPAAMTSSASAGRDLIFLSRVMTTSPSPPTIGSQWASGVPGGTDGIPAEWRAKLAMRELIEQRACELHAMGQGEPGA